MFRNWSPIWMRDISNKWNYQENKLPVNPESKPLVYFKFRITLSDNTPPLSFVGHKYSIVKDWLTIEGTNRGANWWSVKLEHVKIIEALGVAEEDHE